MAEAVRQGYETRALIRDASRAGRLDAGAQKVTGELTRAETLAEAVADIDAVIFTQGSSYGDAAAAEAVDYGAVKNILQALGGRPVRIALMTAIGVTLRASTHDWKRRSERLVRAAGTPTQSSGPAGSTTTTTASWRSRCCRATHATRGAPQTASSRVARSPASSSTASPPMPPIA